MIMPRFSNIELIDQILTFTEAKNIFLYVYEPGDELAYQILDMINETYLKLLDQYTSDSVQIFKSSAPDILKMAQYLPAVIHLNQTGDHDIFYLEGQTQNSLGLFVHECIVRNAATTPVEKAEFVSPFLSKINSQIYFDQTTQIY